MFLLHVSERSNSFCYSVKFSNVFDLFNRVIPEHGVCNIHVVEGVQVLTWIRVDDR